MSLNYIQFANLHRKLKKEGGFSANSHTGAAPEVGYMVSIPGYEQQIRSQNFAPGHIKEFMERHADQLKGDDRYVGGWDDRDINEVSLDVSQNVRPNAAVAREYGDAVADADARTSAEDLLISRNQKSGYDVKRDDVFFNAHFDSNRRQDPAA